MSVESALSLIESVKDYKVLFVGDSIIDEYTYVRPLGKSPKEHLIPVSFIESEVFEGGTKAAANHARTFCKTVDLCASPTAVRKVRYIDHYFRKLFEVQYDPLLARNTYFDGDYDAVVVTDFGHDRVTGEMIVKLVEKPFLAVAAQTNSSNIGFNLITKYPRADYIVIDEPEARLAAADRHSHIQDVIERLAHGRCNKFIVTHGHHGAYGYDGKHYHSPALSKHPLDTMGAGDAFFAVTAPMAKTGSMEDLLLIGNAAGALKTQIKGHRESVTKEKLVDFLRSC
jgi:bifunctional ADP-heptose synthase (sugar kinase/adenylyltransferase)